MQRSAPPRDGRPRQACRALRDCNLSIYDAGYVALAELLDVALVTLDQRTAGAPGLRCAVATP
jgi:predicted nucleic acid-binding protein